MMYTRNQMGFAYSSNRMANFSPNLHYQHPSRMESPTPFHHVAPRHPFTPAPFNYRGFPPPPPSYPPFQRNNPARFVPDYEYMNDWEAPQTQAPSRPENITQNTAQTPEINTNYLKSLMSAMNLTDQQSTDIASCFVHAGLNSLVKATRDEDPTGWLMNRMNETIHVDARTGDFTFNWADGQQMTITQSQLQQYRGQKYRNNPMNDLSLATELAWFTKHPNQQKTGGYTHDVYSELFGLDAGYMMASDEALNLAKQKGVVSAVSGHSNVGTFHAWALDYEGNSWDLKNSDVRGGFKYAPQTQHRADVNLKHSQLREALLRDENAYISYFTIPN